jgi:hypothetical protein
MSARPQPWAVAADPDEEGRWPKWLAYPLIGLACVTLWGLCAGAWGFISLYYSH